MSAGVKPWEVKAVRNKWYVYCKPENPVKLKRGEGSALAYAEIGQGFLGVSGDRAWFSTLEYTSCSNAEVDVPPQADILWGRQLDKFVEPMSLMCLRSSEGSLIWSTCCYSSAGSWKW
jgi:hypothetical protein